MDSSALPWKRSVRVIPSERIEESRLCHPWELPGGEPSPGTIAISRLATLARNDDRYTDSSREKNER